MENIIYTTIDRVKQYIDYKSISNRKFSESIGVSHSLIAKTKSLGSDKLEKILSTYPEINPTWLITGEGNMLRDNINNCLPINEIPTNGDMPAGAIPFYDLPVSAGSALFNEGGSLEPDGYILDFPGVGNTEASLPVYGTSMYPEIKDGAIIGVKKVENWDCLNTQHKYLIITNDERMVKYIKYDPLDSSILWCISPNYSDFKILKDEIVEMHRVTFVLNIG